MSLLDICWLIQNDDLKNSSPNFLEWLYNSKEDTLKNGFVHIMKVIWVQNDIGPYTDKTDFVVE